MKLKTLALLGGVGGAILISSSAQAAFDRIVVQRKMVGNLDPSNPSREIAVYNLYAMFTHPDDQLVTVYGDLDDPLDIQTDATGHANPAWNGFWNPFNGSLPPSQAIIDVFPEAEWDSYLTIGTKRRTIPFGPINGNDVNSPYEHPSQAVLSPGFDPLAPFTTPTQIFTDNGFVFAPPTIADAPGPPDNPDLPQIKTPQTLAGPDGLVLFAQLSMTSTTGMGDPSSIFGYVNIGVREKDADPPNTFREIRHLWVPSPGALALLGIAGLTGVRRRR
ncbi:MAG: hypothetical protein ACYS0G_12635 [Planctomycetota bacterium]|jgi:hypothetical protein